jgi:hypothetical protein
LGECPLSNRDWGNRERTPWSRPQLEASLNEDVCRSKLPGNFREVLDTHRVPDYPWGSVLRLTGTGAIASEVSPVEPPASLSEDVCRSKLPRDFRWRLRWLRSNVHNVLEADGGTCHALPCFSPSWPSCFSSGLNGASERFGISHLEWLSAGKSACGSEI